VLGRLDVILWAREAEVTASINPVPKALEMAPAH